jgi:FKBP-type peptidyl-prolyl cis-trans isomerase SlpA
MNDSAPGRIALRDLDGRTPAPGVIGPGSQVTLHFSLALAEGNRDGELIDSNFGKAPVTFTIGDGNLLPGFEQALFGLVAGDRRDFTLEPADAFGPVNEDNVQRFPLYNFPPDLALDTGLMVEFDDAAGNRQAGVVRSVGKQWVEVDFNHPLAGRALRFSVHVHDVRQVTQA